MGGAVSLIMFLQIGCGVIPVSQFLSSVQEALGMGWLQNPWVPLQPWHLQFTPSDQAFQGEVGFWGERIVYVGVLAAHPDPGRLIDEQRRTP